MTGQRAIWRLAACIATAVFVARGPAHAADICAQTSSREQLECLAGETTRLQGVLDGLYSAILAKLPDHDPADKRRDRAQLVRAEDAWKVYVDQNCTFAGAAEGGSNSWVSNFISRCEIDELGKRIAFLKSLNE